MPYHNRCPSLLDIGILGVRLVNPPKEDTAALELIKEGLGSVELSVVIPQPNPSIQVHTFRQKGVILWDVSSNGVVVMLHVIGTDFQYMLHSGTRSRRLCTEQCAGRGHRVKIWALPHPSSRYRMQPLGEIPCLKIQALVQKRSAHRAPFPCVRPHQQPPYPIRAFPCRRRVPELVGAVPRRHLSNWILRSLTQSQIR
jgi:hypothetical protein